MASSTSSRLHGGGPGTAPRPTRADTSVLLRSIRTLWLGLEVPDRAWIPVRKSILFLLPTNFAPVFIIVLAILLGLTLPVTPVQIL
jgi:hypothetical protein